MSKFCESCTKNKASLIRPKTKRAVCLDCFYEQFENELHFTITKNNLFSKGEKIAVAASGGKDSTVLAYTMNLLNKKYDYGLDLCLLSVDEGITGYRDDSLETVQKNKISYGLPLEIVGYQELFGWTMDQIVSHLNKGKNKEGESEGQRLIKSCCTFCGVFRRQALDRGATIIKADKIVTGHNADDIAETVLMNILRDIITGKDSLIPRCKPFKYIYEKEIVLYAYHKKLEYFSTECIYSPTAYRGYVRELIKDLEKIRSSAIIDIIHSAEQITISEEIKMPQKMTCSQCGFISSNKLCKACVLLKGLNEEKKKIVISIENK